MILWASLDDIDLRAGSLSEFPIEHDLTTLTTGCELTFNLFFIFSNYFDCELHFLFKKDQSKNIAIDLTVRGFSRLNLFFKPRWFS
jgi:hypothetical protein